jgi:hypothetical protein
MNPMSNFMDENTKIKLEDSNLFVWHLLKMKPSTMASISDRNRAREVLYREALTIHNGLIDSYRQDLSIKPLGMVSAALQSH